MKCWFQKVLKNKDEFKTKVAIGCTQLLAVRESIFNLVEGNDHYAILNHDHHTMAVYFEYDKKRFKELRDKMNKIAGKKILYCFSFSDILDENLSDWKDIEVKPIPADILKIYEEVRK